MTKRQLKMGFAALLAVAILCAGVAGAFLWLRGEPFPRSEIDAQTSFLDQKIEAYKSQFGVYPTTLDDLHLAELPRPSWGTRQWEYRRLKEDIGFELILRKSDDDYVAVYYSSESGKWRVDS
jgi:hypothetical protein